MIDQKVKSRQIILIILFLAVVIFTIWPLKVFNSGKALGINKIQNSSQISIIAQNNQKDDNSLLMPNNPQVKSNSIEKEKVRVEIPWFFQGTVIFTFIWLLVGVSVNYGFRMYHNSPIHPSFIPFVFVTVAAIIAFSVVMAFDIAIGGSIDFEILGQKFTGASGPAILWVLTFLAIMAGLNMTKASELASSDAEPNPPSHHLFKRKKLDKDEIESSD
ncbi:MAG: hypothetical protein QNJ64_05235 [Crocosphaera sp.]|nr:hypothetical protein [Crocosphaera sp.]